MFMWHINRSIFKHTFGNSVLSATYLHNCNNICVARQHFYLTTAKRPRRLARCALLLLLNWRTIENFVWAASFFYFSFSFFFVVFIFCQAPQRKWFMTERNAARLCRRCLSCCLCLPAQLPSYLAATLQLERQLPVVHLRLGSWSVCCLCQMCNKLVFWFCALPAKLAPSSSLRTLQMYVQKLLSFAEFLSCISYS